jgi:hypothetical protein
VRNDERADWSAAWALFPGTIAYVWHGALHATTVAESLTRQRFAIRGAKAAMGMPKLRQPIEVEGAPRELPEIGRIDLGHEGIEVLNLLPVCKAPDAEFIQPCHDDADLDGTALALAPAEFGKLLADETEK